MDPYIKLTAIIAVFISLSFLYRSLLQKKKRGDEGIKSKEAPEPAGAWPIIGHLHLLGGGDELLYRIFGTMADKYGPAFNIRLGSRRAFVVSSWEVAKECFTINDKALASRPTTVAAKHMGYNYAVFGFAPYSPFWREMRKIATLELLSNRRLEMLKHVRASEVDMGIRELYDSCVKNSSGRSTTPLLVELKRWLEDLTLNVVVRMVAGKRYFGASAAGDDGEARRCQKAISQFFHLIGIFVVSDALPFLGWLDLQGHERAMKKTAMELDSILEVWLEEHRRRRSSGEIKGEGEQDFIDVMLSLQEEGQLSNFQYDADTSIKSTCLAVILGGSDTTAGTLAWAISLLLNNRHVLKKAQEELDLHVGMERQVDESDIKNLTYLQAIIKETLRLYPAGPLLGPREAFEDCTVAGYHVPAGTRLVVNVWKIQRDPRVWSNPSTFQPERFTTSHATVDVRGQQFELIPFGSGRRSCPGLSFALQVLHLTLARLLHCFELATPLDQPVDMTESPGLTIPKATPLEVLLKPRLHSKLYGY
ncbi:xanthotoxin 5-hydroxylase CYP82C4-like [Juglans microcarpa x Juglans regia]|uniref:xanthotoxin 5-hydroxylase CYP82C4-like n=1 Tax=Juglans microcarpa x Juglans regia TaxID=2249226 RepID=UPI001B7E0137|nr:xanthotoxin 5-hydroxylase CYP82C4-like [Juglans microcarpa x Juglans regia]